MVRTSLAVPRRAADMVRWQICDKICVSYGVGRGPGAVGGFAGGVGGPPPGVGGVRLAVGEAPGVGFCAPGHGGGRAGFVVRGVRGMSPANLAGVFQPALSELLPDPIYAY